MNRFIYMDNAATTFVDKRVFDAMEAYLTNMCFNPSSIYDGAQNVHSAIDEARDVIAKTLNCTSKEIFFTSCGTESDNWSIKGIAKMNAYKGKHIITSKIEHHTVLQSTQSLEKEGFDVTYLPVDSDGLVRVEDVKKSIRNDKNLVSIMYANNEIGTIEPIKEIGTICREKKYHFM